MKAIYSIKFKKSSAAVSLFVVIFATLLITVVTVGFTRIMIKGQQQATVTDLSQSAYDSALAGVEDAKRALLRYQSICDSGGDCDLAKQKIMSETCNEAVDTLEDIEDSHEEVKIETNGSNLLDQAYTCVKINLETVDYLGSLAKDESDIISLNGVGAFDRIKIEWFNLEDAGSTGIIELISPTGVSPLPTTWTAKPPILRAQMIQFGNNFSLSDFDNDQGSTDTIFLYPAEVGASNINFVSDKHQAPTNAPVNIDCDSNINSGGYSCAATIVINSPMDNRYLRLSSIYNKTNYRITLLNGSNIVKFDSVQPEIDSTGRTNDMFRRVKSRVELNTNFPYPEATIDITGNLCKDFIVTDNTSHYVNSCTP